MEAEKWDGEEVKMMEGKNIRVAKEDPPSCPPERPREGGSFRAKEDSKPHPEVGSPK
jgi:hypothetical protein